MESGSAFESHSSDPRDQQAPKIRLVVCSVPSRLYLYRVVADGASYICIKVRAYKREFYEPAAANVYRMCYGDMALQTIKEIPRAGEKRMQGCNDGCSLHTKNFFAFSAKDDAVHTYL